MNPPNPPRPGRRKGCPPWCEVNHGKPLDPVHRSLVAEVHRGECHVTITVQSDPRDPGPVVAVDAWDLAADANGGVLASPAEASGLAVIMTALGLPEVAGYLRTAAGMLGEAGQ